MKYLVIGDVHGEYEQVKNILDKYFSISDKVIFLGDYIDKNKNSLKTLDFLLDLKQKNKEKVVLIWGNHDIFLINSILYKNKKTFHTWFYINKVYMTTLFDYVCGNDRVLFKNGYEEFIDEYFYKLSEDKYLLELSKKLLELGQFYFKDNTGFFIHGGFPINVISRNSFKYIEIYNSIGEQGLINLEKDYKNGVKTSINFFAETSKYDPTWFAGAWGYESITKETFEKLLKELGVKKIFVGHKNVIKKPKFPKGNLLNCLNIVNKEIVYYYGE